MLSPSRRTSPSIRALGTKSFIRLKHRIKVLLPQPEGPISAVILFRGMSIVMSFRAGEAPYQTQSLQVERTVRSHAGDGVSPAWVESGRAVAPVSVWDLGTLMVHPTLRITGPSLPATDDRRIDDGSDARTTDGLDHDLILLWGSDINQP